MQVPPEVIKQIEKRRVAFLWAGNKDFSAGKCLVAWPTVCTTKDLGGLGIRDFGTHNICLLLNLIHRLRRADSSAWVNWIKEKVDIANMQGDNLGHHCDLLKSLLPLYQVLTTVELGMADPLSSGLMSGPEMKHSKIAFHGSSPIASERRALYSRRSPPTFRDAL